MNYEDNITFSAFNASSRVVSSVKSNTNFQRFKNSRCLHLQGLMW
jgi:hypothetical protein